MNQFNPDFYFGVTPGDVIYDIETYPNVFTLTAKHATTGSVWYFELSPWRDDAVTLCKFINVLRDQGCRMVGFNNVGFDYPVVHRFMRLMQAHDVVNAEVLYDKAMGIIKSQGQARFEHNVWESDWIVPQIDLFKIHHFDNKNRGTSLKVLEFNMRMDSVEDLPFPVGTHLNEHQVKTLAEYNLHDIEATLNFYNHSIDQIKFRETLTEKYNKNFINHNDTKIGKEYFIMELERHTPGCCYRKIDGRKRPVQTIRESINLGDVILPYINFTHPEFQRVHNWFLNKTITETKDSIKDLSCTIYGFTYHFGTGGIHGSVESQTVKSDEHFIVEDWDVASYYPNLAIVNKLYPAHLGKTFCTIYKDVYEQRKQHAKGTPENAMLKLALNGVYGDSNNQYSPFFDPQYTMAITINGQLSLCMLGEALIQCMDLQMIQINTDGLTIRYPRHMKEWVHGVAVWWEKLTGLQLENVEYDSMFIRDVNNYIAIPCKGDVKRKGAYEYELAWHQNHSALIVPKAAEAVLVHGKNIRQFVESHDDVMDFMLRTKIPRSDILEWGGEKVQSTSRYYVSTDGDYLEKISPPKGNPGWYKKAHAVSQEDYERVMADTGGAWDERVNTKNKSIYEERRTQFHTGWTVKLCNNMKNVSEISDINYEYYIREVEKLVEPLLI
jgi:hypothetical protein